MTESLSVLIVEDAAYSFYAVSSWLKEAGYRILPQVGSIADAETVLLRDRPDVLIMDLDLDPRKPNELKRLKASATFVVEMRVKYPHLIILVHSAESKLRLEVVPIIMNAGISYLVKEAVMGASHLDHAIRLAKTGAAVYDRHVVRFFDKIIPSSSNFGELTPREWDVASLVEKMTYEQMANCLGIKVNRVNEIMQNIMRKLHFSNRAEVAVWYRQQRLDNKAPTPPECEGQDTL